MDVFGIFIIPFRLQLLMAALLDPDVRKLFWT
jgi:hypothetical protein